jgi:hypothetical protein
MGSLDERGRAKRATRQLLSSAVANDPSGDFRNRRGLYARRAAHGHSQTRGFSQLAAMRFRVESRCLP